MKPALAAAIAGLSDQTPQYGAVVKNLGPEDEKPGLNLTSATQRFLHNSEQIT